MVLKKVFPEALRKPGDLPAPLFTTHPHLHPQKHQLPGAFGCLQLPVPKGLHFRGWRGLFPSVARASAASRPVIRRRTFKQALSLCIQSRFMRADKDVT
jgi:hypothetical protein